MDYKERIMMKTLAQWQDQTTKFGSDGMACTAIKTWYGIDKQLQHIEDLISHAEHSVDQKKDAAIDDAD